MKIHEQGYRVFCSRVHPPVHGAYKRFTAPAPPHSKRTHPSAENEKNLDASFSPSSTPASVSYAGATEPPPGEGFDPFEREAHGPTIVLDDRKGAIHVNDTSPGKINVWTAHFRWGTTHNRTSHHICMYMYGGVLDSRAPRKKSIRDFRAAKSAYNISRLLPQSCIFYKQYR